MALLGLMRAIWSILKNRGNLAFSIVGSILLAVSLTQYSCAPVDHAATVQRKIVPAPASYQTVPVVEFCTLLREPHSFESRVITINGSLGRFRDYITFYDATCTPKHPLINVVVDSRFHDKSRQNAQLEQILWGSPDAREGNVHINVSATGLLRSIPRELRSDSTELQYEYIVTRIEPTKN